MHILFLSRWYPYPADNGSKIRIANLLQGLSQRHQVSLLSFYDPRQGEPDHRMLKTLCQEVQTVPWQPFHPQSWRARLGYFSTIPRAYLDMYSEEMERRIRAILNRSQVDLVIASQIDMAAYATVFSGIPAIFEEVETGVFLDRIAQAGSRTARLRHRLTWLKHRRYLASLLKHFRACTVVSDQERRILERELAIGKRVEVIPNCVDLNLFPPESSRPQPYSLVFTGSLTYQPNYQAIIWFLQEIFPRVLRQVPSTRFVITGDHGNLPLPSLEGVTLTGLVADVRPYLSGAWCSVVPLKTGGGTRLKILEAMAMRTPVVTTSKGAEGLEMESGVHGFIVDQPQGFAEMILELFRSPALRQQIAANAYSFVQRRYNWETVMPRFLELVEATVREDQQAVAVSQQVEHPRMDGD